MIIPYVDVPLVTIETWNVIDWKLNVTFLNGNTLNCVIHIEFPQKSSRDIDENGEWFEQVGECIIDECKSQHIWKYEIKVFSTPTPQPWKAPNPENHDTMQRDPLLPYLSDTVVNFWSGSKISVRLLLTPAGIFPKF